MTNDSAIEAAFKAHEDIPTWDDDPVGRDSAIRWHMRGFNDALAVFEKAHAPTDDEREALRIAHLDARQAAYRKEVEDWCVDHDSSPEIAGNAFFRGWDAAVDGGFRRSEASESSAETWVCGKCGGAAYEHSLATSTCIWEPVETRPEPQGEPSDAQPEIIRLARDFTKPDVLNRLIVTMMTVWGERDPRSTVAQHPASYVATFADMARAIVASGVVAEEPDIDAEPCKAEIWSWEIFRHQEVDPYWMRCHQVGAHDEHENSETGATWPVKQEGQSDE